MFGALYICYRPLSCGCKKWQFFVWFIYQESEDLWPKSHQNVLGAAYFLPFCQIVNTQDPTGLWLHSFSTNLHQELQPDSGNTFSNILASNSSSSNSHNFASKQQASRLSSREYGFVRYNQLHFRSEVKLWKVVWGGHLKSDGLCFISNLSFKLKLSYCLTPAYRGRSITFNSEAILRLFLHTYT